MHGRFSHLVVYGVAGVEAGKSVGVGSIECCHP
jgi:hypothetical protein